jgi:Lrp/AsnC family leucine-responsive transcriptional regulator
MTGDKLDEFDLKILSILQEQARIGMGKLGHLVGLSDSAVTRRIEKLEEAGLIQKYVAIVDRQKTDYPVLVLLMLKLKDPNADSFAKFEQKINAMPEVQSCYMVSGSWNYIIHVMAATPQSYALWIHQHILDSSNVDDIESAYLMKECKKFGPIGFFFQG